MNEPPKLGLYRMRHDHQRFMRLVRWNIATGLGTTNEGGVIDFRELQRRWVYLPGLT